MSEDYVYQSGIATGSVLQLRPRDSEDYIEIMRERSASFRSLYEHFSAQGFAFHIDRAQVFVYRGSTMGEPRSRNRQFRASVIGILPSFQPTFASEPGHDAVSIAVHDSGSAIAGAVRVEHNPFRLARFSLHEFDIAGDIVEKSIDAEALVSSSIEAVVNRFGGLASRDGTERQSESREEVIDGTTAALDSADLVQVSTMIFRSLINDRYARPIYPAAAVSALLHETPLVQKFAIVATTRAIPSLSRLGRVPNRLAFQARVNADDVIQGSCTSTSTSCNACTSTSTSTIEF